MLNNNKRPKYLCRCNGYENKVKAIKKAVDIIIINLDSVYYT